MKEWSSNLEALIIDESAAKRKILDNYTDMNVFACVQPFSTTFFGTPFPLSTPQGCQARQLRTMPEHEF